MGEEKADLGDDGNTPGSRLETLVGDPELASFLRIVLGTAVAVSVVVVSVFAVSGLWPPLVAIESASMEPNIDTGDMVFLMSEERFAGAEADHGVVTAATGSRTGYTRFGRAGDVIVYQPNGQGERTPVIHRAMLWVERGENWYDRADPAFVGRAQNCRELRNCPAPHGGFITKGDYNDGYDQVGSRPISRPVRPEWVVGTAEARVPGLGRIRLRVGLVTRS